MAAPTQAALDRSAAAIAAHRARMRRLGRVYAAVIAAVVVAGAVIVSLVWVSGEVHNTHLRTAANPPDAVAAAAPSPTLTQAWHTPDRVALGVAIWRGTVVTFGKHVVRGRDARTGKVTWSYTRSNRTACSAAQANGTTVAIFRVNGNCDEVTALDSETGARRWTRTLDMDGHPVNGTPGVIVTPFSVLVRTPAVIYDFDPSSGYDRWEYHPAGCTITAAALGDAGALISQTCAHPECGDVRPQLCGDGPQLLLRDAYEGRDGDNKHTGRNKDGMNQDQLIWNDIGNTDVPVSAGAVISALNRTTRALDVLAAATGKVRATLAVSPAPTSLTGASAALTNGSAIVRIGAAVHAVDADGAQVWALPASGPATVTVPTESSWPPAVTDARVSVPDETVIVQVEPATGAVLARSTLPRSLADGAFAFPLGAGYLVAEPTGVTAYR
jgi:outer membrane protein assembly factor BamB